MFYSQIAISHYFQPIKYIKMIKLKWFCFLQKSKFTTYTLFWMKYNENNGAGNVILWLTRRNKWLGWWWLSDIGQQELTSRSFYQVLGQLCGLQWANGHLGKGGHQRLALKRRLDLDLLGSSKSSREMCAESQALNLAEDNTYWMNMAHQWSFYCNIVGHSLCVHDLILI